jgi:hypothetical protein
MEIFADEQVCWPRLNKCLSFAYYSSVKLRNTLPLLIAVPLVQHHSGFLILEPSPCSTNSMISAGRFEAKHCTAVQSWVSF